MSEPNNPRKNVLKEHSKGKRTGMEADLLKKNGIAVGNKTRPTERCKKL